MGAHPILRLGGSPYAADVPESPAHDAPPPPMLSEAWHIDAWLSGVDVPTHDDETHAPLTRDQRVRWLAEAYHALTERTAERTTEHTTGARANA